MKIHKSMLQSWIICPKKFFYQYHERLPPYKSFRMQIGAAFHDFAKWFFTQLDPMLLLEMKSYTDTFEYFKSRIPTRGHDMLKELAENFCIFEANRWWHASRHMDDPLGFFFPVATEIYVESPELAGTIDRIDRVNEDELLVLEYKTGNKIYITDVRRELAFYCMLVNESNAFPEKVTHIGCYNPTINDFFVEPLGSRTDKAMKKRLVQFKKAVEENDFQKKLSFFCADCWYREKCVWVDENE